MASCDCIVAPFVATPLCDSRSVDAPKPLEVRVVLPSGRSLDLPNVERWHGVATLKERIRLSEGVPVTQQRLFAAGLELDDASLVSTAVARMVGNEPRLRTANMLAVLKAEGHEAVNEILRQAHTIHMELAPAGTETDTAEQFEILARKNARRVECLLERRALLAPPVAIKWTPASPASIGTCTPAESLSTCSESGDSEATSLSRQSSFCPALPSSTNTEISDALSEAASDGSSVLQSPREADVRFSPQGSDATTLLSEPSLSVLTTKNYVRIRQLQARRRSLQELGLGLDSLSASFVAPVKR